MRTQALILMLGIVPYATSCSGESQTNKPEGDDDDDVVGDDDDDDSACDTATSDCGGGDLYFEPVAVGFEFDGVLLANGQLTGYNIDGYGYIEPTMYLYFASERFFQVSGDEQDGEYCIAAANFAPTPAPRPGIPTNGSEGPTNLYTSYEVALDVFGHTCTGMVDPDTWGADAENLWGPFIGAHLGYGFAPMTAYLQDAWSKESLNDYGDSMVASYVAINDASGNWVGDDWTTGILFQWDPVTETLVVDAKDYLQAVDISGTPPGSNLPEGYMRSFAYWYQDFPLMDFSNLTDGAP